MVLLWTVGLALLIGKESQYHVPMLMGQQQMKSDGVAVTAPVNMEIPERTIQLIWGELQEEYGSFCEALIELTSGTPPTNLCIAWTLISVQARKVILQVRNVSPTPTTIQMYEAW